MPLSSQSGPASRSVEHREVIDQASCRCRPRILSIGTGS